jgi:penicillin-binding protein 1A
MKLALADKPATPFKIPPGLRLVRIDAKSGMRPNPGEGGRTILEAFKPGTVPPDNYAPIGVADVDGRVPQQGMPPDAGNMQGISPDAGNIMRPGTGRLY